ncbi:MAG TPA: hypothetical protein VF092_20370 [Longimicrobium sp.]
MTRMTSAGDYDRNVFVNCPFDARYHPIFRAVVFTIYECGFVARTALEADDGGEERIRKIKRIIRDCRYGIHDISRVQLDPRSHLPRFNMPLELGLFLGAREYGTGVQKLKRTLILDRERYRYQQFCSDIAGQDIRAHGNDPGEAIAAVRAMLATALDGVASIPGPAKIRERYARFTRDLPAVCRLLFVRRSELQFVEMRRFVAAWVRINPLIG